MGDLAESPTGSAGSLPGLAGPFGAIISPFREGADGGVRRSPPAGFGPGPGPGPILTVTSSRPHASSSVPLPSNRSLANSSVSVSPAWGKV